LRFDKLKKLNYKTTPIAIILGGYVNGLGLVRSLGEIGVPSIVIDINKNIAFSSKYSIIGLISPHPTHQTAEFLNFMKELGQKLKTKSVLFCTNDMWLIPMSKNQLEMEQYFYYPMSGWNIIENCINKTKLYKLAVEADVPCPETVFLNSISEVDKNIDNIRFPCVLKPAIIIGFQEKLQSPGRTIIIQSNKELEYWKKIIVERNLSDVPLIIQEMIIGGSENLYTLTSYSNREGDIIAYSTGHKIRQNPPNAGTIVSGRVVHEPEVFALGKKLLKKAKFYGIANTEFKRDIKNGGFKLIEINPRPGMWNYSVTATGINLPQMAYLEVLGKKLVVNEAFNKRELVWLMVLSDFMEAINFSNKNRRSYGYSTLSEWLVSIKGRKIDAVFMVNDPKPGLKYMVQFCRSMLASIARKILKKSKIQSPSVWTN
jgi:predicted ATP-grasp superfamily ATP-dependent carboligase